MVAQSRLLIEVLAEIPDFPEQPWEAPSAGRYLGARLQRRLQTGNVLTGYSDWPGLAQVFSLERRVISKKTGEVRTEIVAGVTSVPPECADATRLLALVRGHWHIENQSPDEERSAEAVLAVMRALRVDTGAYGSLHDALLLRGV